jgi:hypothetical protein
MFAVVSLQPSDPLNLSNPEPDGAAPEARRPHDPSEEARAALAAANVFRLGDLWRNLWS